MRLWLYTNVVRFSSVKSLTKFCRIHLSSLDTLCGPSVVGCCGEGQADCCVGDEVIGRRGRHGDQHDSYGGRESGHS